MRMHDHRECYDYSFTIFKTKTHLRSSIVGLGPGRESAINFDGPVGETALSLSALRTGKKWR